MKITVPTPVRRTAKALRFLFSGEEYERDLRTTKVDLHDGRGDIVVATHTHRLVRRRLGLYHEIDHESDAAFMRTKREWVAGCSTGVIGYFQSPDFLDPEKSLADYARSQYWDPYERK